MPGYQITCPYCFEEFMDDQVHFRMETVFTDTSDFGFANPTSGQPYLSLADIEHDTTLSDELRAGFSDRFKVFSGLLAGTDADYDDFWSDFGGTSEMSAPGGTATAGSHHVDPWQRPVHDPQSEPDFFLDSGDTSDGGMLYRIMDAGGNETARRVCPYCHNPLPGLYGQYPVKFVPVIGMTGVGKTVYLSQLVDSLQEAFAKCGISAQPSTVSAYRYRAANPVEAGVPLPYATMPQALQQPLFVDLTYTDEVGRPHALTMVFYDISGEHFRQFSDDESYLATRSMAFLPFIQHASGILYLTDPKRLETPDPVYGPQVSLTVIQNLISGDGPVQIPLALCIAKGDTVAQSVFGSDALSQLEPLMDGDKYRPVFNADGFNAVYGPVSDFVGQSLAMSVTMPMQYPNHNLFMVSALGAAPEEMADDDGHTELMMTVPPVPQRLIEPVLWMLNRFGFIGASGPISNPSDWTCPQCGASLAVDQEFCPDCRIGRNGDWTCSLCGTVNPVGNAQCSHAEQGFLGIAKQCKGMRPAVLQQMVPAPRTVAGASATAAGASGSAAAGDSAGASAPVDSPSVQPMPASAQPEPVAYPPARPSAPTQAQQFAPAAPSSSGSSSFFGGQGSLGQLMNRAQQYVQSEEFAAQRDRTISGLSARFEEGKRRAKEAYDLAAEEARRTAADAKRAAEAAKKAYNERPNPNPGQGSQSFFGGLFSDSYGNGSEGSSANPFAAMRPSVSPDSGHSAPSAVPTPPSVPVPPMPAQPLQPASSAAGTASGAEDAGDAGPRCSNCGAPLVPGSIFCTNCGTPA
ncbi:TRAFAC clade GTPase domain-containing protein [Bifidobacterium callimiconis]|uniref:Uncharacterized protein n=1 Tax=Bifidobacterium callimiconis TaxID=2306973 RepID=A0A430FC45_9BIFI|nr:zinc-ribbon domain-containing protein [Bifidobacterium callimiconis]MBT1177687.1 zinc-ribbon domain-containing protein [Bifidobacterium callimiconis]RSX50362.1 hypothetical protein D2E23_1685 [Bifidobacterium callimiconis]